MNKAQSIMKLLSGISLVVFICLSIGCHQYAAVENYTVFTTPFGPVAKGDSMREVVSRLGNPMNVSNYKRKEVWSYNFEKTGEVFVYFEKGNVIDMQFPNKPKTCDKCKGEQ
ncbi:MAG: DUF2845 domain-containing protein [Candidatus Omnitrophica bacterium]|nr:DUF2845 domain-containing protein [Candidatus Omnitrophota bacterium]